MLAHDALCFYIFLQCAPAWIVMSPIQTLRHNTTALNGVFLPLSNICFIQPRYSAEKLL